MTTISGSILSLIFLAISALHFFWAFGGKTAFAAALPTNEKGERLLNPRKIDSAIVGTGLLAMALFVLIKIQVIDFQLPSWALESGMWVIAGIFFLRAIGDFRYVGFFKKVKGTPFGQMDSKYFSPLCLLIGSLALAIQWLS